MKTFLKTTIFAAFVAASLGSTAQARTAFHDNWYAHHNPTAGSYEDQYAQ
jgi:hypothetical protein